MDRGWELKHRDKETQQQDKEGRLVQGMCRMSIAVERFRQRCVQLNQKIEVTEEGDKRIGQKIETVDEELEQVLPEVGGMEMCDLKRVMMYCR